MGDLLLHQLTDQSPWVTTNGWIFGSGIFILAGIYQFTPLKYHCLDKCRSPLSFIMGHWTGQNERSQALKLGLHHGVFRVCCCWSLMLLIFAAGADSIGWMLSLGALMAVEKNMPWGRRISKPLGGLLLVWGGTLAAIAFL